MKIPAAVTESFGPHPYRARLKIVVVIVAIYVAIIIAIVALDWISQ